VIQGNDYVIIHLRNYLFLYSASKEYPNKASSEFQVRTKIMGAPIATNDESFMRGKGPYPHYEEQDISLVHERFLMNRTAPIIMTAPTTAPMIRARVTGKFG
jgi:hypothetical protein